MGYQVLARKYRPQRFADVAGQDHVTRTLLNALTQNRIAHGYIFSGHRGIGKTTIARILAMALNCHNQPGTPERPTHEPCLKCFSCREISSGGNPDSGNQASHSFDFIEIDAASNRGIDDVRSIRTQASVQPARDRYKIFLLDEAHQITEAAFNAILKTLEEPPEWTIFMMATTEPENIPQTIRSRCQHFSFHAVKFDDILAQLRQIATKEEVQAEDTALALLAEAGDGSMRDALSIMDQAIASAPCENNRPVLSAIQIRELMGSVPNTIFERLMEAVAAGNSADLMEEINVLLNAGHSPFSLARQIIRYIRNTLMAKLGGEKTELLQISNDERARAARTALLFTEEEITRCLQIMLNTFDALNETQEHRFHLELGLLKLVHAQRLLPIEQLLSSVGGGIQIRSTPQPSGFRPTGSKPTSTSPAPASRPTPSSPTPSASSSSPFGAGGGGWNPGPPLRQSAPIAPVAAPIATATVTELEPAKISAPPATISTLEALPPTPAPVSEPAIAAPAPDPAEEPAEVAALKNPANIAEITEAANIDTLRLAVISALADAGHATAAQLLGAGAWTIDGSSLRIEVSGIGKKMLSLTVNPAAEKIIRQELQRLGAPSRFLVVPGEGPASSAAIAPIAPAGSVQDTALANPLVQRAKEIFQAEVRSVVDLRTR
jgi:DNA polymerase-3 subunit gamma/tau